MSTVTERVRGRVDVSAATAGVALGDLLVMGAFVAVGRLSHGGSLTEFGALGGAMAPFLLGWLVAAVPARVYDARVWRSPRRAALHVLGAWFVADVVAQLLRLTPYFSGNATLQVALQFGLVSLVFGSLFLGSWRVLLAVVSARLSSTAPA